MKSELYLASTYLRVLLSANDQARIILQEALGDELESVLNKEYLTGEIVSRIFHHCAEAGIPSWVVSFGNQLSIASHGPLGFAALSSPDLCSALKVLSEFLEIRINAVSAEYRHEDTRLVVELTDNSGDELTGRWLIEANFLVVQSITETIIAHRLGDHAKFEFSHARPDYASALDKCYRVKCKYGAAANQFSVPASWAHIPSPLFDEASYRTNLAKCREIKLAMGGPHQDIVQTVRARLMTHFDRRLSGQTKSDQVPSLKMLASESFMSTRTLIRKLERGGESYKSLLSDIRREQACYLLKSTHLTAAEIGEKLGYQEPANFGRAFRQWYATTPTQWRRQA